MATPTALLRKLEVLAEKEDFAAVTKIICAEIAKAKDGKSIEALEGAEVVEEIFSGESDAGPEIGSALLKRAFTVGGAGGADILRVLIGVALYDPMEPLSPVPPKHPHLKTGVLSAVEASRDLLRKGAADKNAAFRASSVYLLLSCAKTDAQDVECVLQRLTAEKDSSVRLTALLATGVLGKQLSAKDQLRAACVAAVEAERKKAYPAKDAPLATACIALACSLLGIEWDKKLATAVNGVLKKPALLPKAWGCHKLADTMWVLLPAFSNQPPAIIEPLIDGIAKMGRDVEKMLYTLAFGDVTQPICGGIGVVLDELSPLQLRVLKAFGTPAFENSYTFREQLGIFGMDSVKEAIDAKTPAWKPISVKTKNGLRELAPAIIWRMASRGMIEMTEAMKALTGLPIADLAELVLYGSDVVQPFNASRKLEDRKRNNEVLVKAVAFLEQNDKEWPKRVREAGTSNKRKIDFSIGYALTRLVKQGKATFEEGNRDHVQMFVLHAMGVPSLFVDDVSVVSPEIRDYIVEDSAPSYLKDLQKFFADYPYRPSK